MKKELKEHIGVYLHIKWRTFWKILITIGYTPIFLYFIISIGKYIFKPKAFDGFWSFGVGMGLVFIGLIFCGIYFMIWDNGFWED